MDKNNILKELLNLINNTGIKNMEELSFGLLYNWNFENDFHVLTIGIREEFHNDKGREFTENSKKFREDTPVHKIYFNTYYELIKYLVWIAYGIELSDIFSFEREDAEYMNFNFSESENLNNILKEIFSEIRNDDEVEESVIQFLKENKEKESEIDNLFEDLNIRETRDIILDSPVYSGNIYSNNCGYAWDNITDFKILHFNINYIRGSEKSVYSLDIKFQIESYLEDSNIVNYYDVEIPEFLIFPSIINDDCDRRMLKNNLSLIYNMTEDIIYSMILKEFRNFREYPVAVSKIVEGISLENFKEEVLSKLAKYLVGLFYVGSRNIYTEEDIMELCNEFMKRSFFEFKKHLFSEFVISSTGMRINDLNTVNSFYTMMEKIALGFEKEKDNERI
ncbi:hypothetical protein EII29_04770 [Leptotrichia sp. OH3620_COT-345]|uniref:hypothetical protein n=1 Tax=Leptotrichia sp. OH3620_COT-345 TaxID=2491048 RepID=UPI000F645522|nr:hypothetical protein [Leptotrichia sp. OH3620_COT-345]RRD39838.1 hypothetical protein EII29_04770 [Leptotrichia sp. OH3620_COT-345]